MHSFRSDIAMTESDPCLYRRVKNGFNLQKLPCCEYVKKIRRIYSSTYEYPPVLGICHLVFP